MKKSYPETDESGIFWILTLLDVDGRLRVACGIGKDETLASHGGKLDRSYLDVKELLYTGPLQIAKNTC